MLGEEKGGGGKYQFAATMGLLLIFTRLDLGFWRTRGREDLFFFFWRGRAILCKLGQGKLEVRNGRIFGYSGGTSAN